ncbi:7082_t:CDS:2, partial [Racocetra fulgida]
YESSGQFSLELILGKISNGLFNRSSQTQVHIKEDREKLSKCEKDAIDFIINNYAKSHNYDSNLRLIKMIFNENLDKVYFSNYGSEDKNYLSNYGSKNNDNNEEKDFYSDEREEEHKEISNRMFTFIPTYNMPRSSINHN